jgi:hypothetical protein
MTCIESSRGICSSLPRITSASKKSQGQLEPAFAACCTARASASLDELLLCDGAVADV